MKSTQGKATLLSQENSPPPTVERMKVEQVNPGSPTTVQYLCYGFPGIFS